MGNLLKTLNKFWGTPTEPLIGTGDLDGGTTNTAEDPLTKITTEFNKQVDDTLKLSNRLNAGKLLANSGIIFNEMTRKPSEPFVAPKLVSPVLISPGQYARQAADDQIAMVSNTSKRLLAETGRVDSTIGINADLMKSANETAASTVVQDITTANQNIANEAEIQNKQAMIDAETRNKNIEKIIQENIQSGMTITQAINASGEIGTQMIAMKTDAEYRKWLAGLMKNKIQWQQDNAIAQNVLGASLFDRTKLVPPTPTVPATTDEESDF